MNYNEALEYIHSAPKIAKPLGNTNLKKVLEKIGSPENKLKFVHIAGTNGKGSTAAMTEMVLRKSGYNTGLFISPFIERFNERIQVCGENISDIALARLTSKVKHTLDSMSIELSEFALILVIAFLYFKEQKCDIVVLETGLGGRADATNCIDKSIVSAITSIGFDHMQYLGNTISEIAGEKAGIIKPYGTIVLYPNPSEDVMRVVADVARKRNANLICCDTPDFEGESLCYKKKNYKLSLVGEYQHNNAAVCLEIIQELRKNGYAIEDEHIADGLKSVKWPGRFEWLSDRLLLDGCHNEEGARKFAESVKNIDKPITVVTGVMCDKDYTAVAEQLCTFANKIIITKPNIPRALEPVEYKKVFSKLGVEAEVVDCPVEAVTTALENHGICAVCGSLYLIGEIRNKFKDKTTH